MWMKELRERNCSGEAGTKQPVGGTEVAMAQRKLSESWAVVIGKKRPPVRRGRDLLVPAAA